MSSALPSYAEAVALVAAQAAELARHPASERIDLAQAAGRVLAASLRADRDQPPFPRSTRDGFACRAADANAHLPLQVAGSIHAGQPSAGPLPPNSVWEIMTGASVPPGADAVAMIEHVDRNGDSPATVRLLPPRTLEPGENIVPQGAEARAGQEVLPPGTRIGPQHTALAAACGHTIVEVFRRPRVAILATGDELVSISAAPGPGQIRNSNGVMLASLVYQAGGDPWILPTASDTAQSLDGSIRKAVSADMLLITGGVSAGKFDLVEPALARIGAKFHFTGVRIQPGKPLVFGSLSRKHHSDSGVSAGKVLPFFGLPGNPISSAATFLLFGSRILGALAGCRQPGPRFALARLAKDVKGKPDLTRFVPSFCNFGPDVDEPPEVKTVPSEGSGDLASFSRSNCFLVVPEGTGRLEAGSPVRILLI
jgi:molybdopterin molybdotransferase